MCQVHIYDSCLISEHCSTIIKNMAGICSKISSSVVKTDDGPRNNISSDDVLEDFFEDIAKLTISSNDDVEVNEDDSTDTTPAALFEIPFHDSNSCEQKGHEEKSKKKVFVNRAETSQKSWQEFSVSTSYNSTTSNSIDKLERPIVSFSLSKKKGKKSRAKKAMAVSLPFPTKESTPLNPPSFQRPCWIAVLDTCAILESYEATYDLISAAVQAGTEFQVTSVEQITVVIPYKLWGELDYRSKEAEDEDQRYKARRAVRMLNKELSSNDNSRYCGKNNSQDDDHTVNAVIRSQSRADMNRASLIFLTNGAKDANNDDHILLCAVDEQRKFVTSQSDARTSGGVVLLTWDHVLSGKARADGVSVYTPVDFLHYHNRRAASLKERVRQDVEDADRQRRR